MVMPQPASSPALWCVFPGSPGGRLWAALALLGQGLLHSHLPPSLFPPAQSWVGHEQTRPAGCGGQVATHPCLGHCRQQVSTVPSWDRDANPIVGGGGTVSLPWLWWAPQGSPWEGIGLWALLQTGAHHVLGGWVLLDPQGVRMTLPLQDGGCCPSSSCPDSCIHPSGPFFSSSCLAPGRLKQVWICTWGCPQSSWGAFCPTRGCPHCWSPQPGQLEHIFTLT